MIYRIDKSVSCLEDNILPYKLRNFPPNFCFWREVLFGGTFEYSLGGIIFALKDLFLVEYQNFGDSFTKHFKWRK